MKGRFGNRQRVEHALDAIAEIEQYTHGQTRESFLANSMMHFACIKQLEIIGEACNHLDESVTGAFPDVEWRNITGLRNFLVHEYFGVDLMLIWDVVSKNIPVLKVQLIQISKTL